MLFVLLKCTSYFLSNSRRSCYHCVNKFHSDFSRRLILRNARLRKILGSKYECITCHKRFKEIANFLLHRTLHEAPHLQNGRNSNHITLNSIRKNDPDIRSSSDSENAIQSIEINDVKSPENERSELEFDPVILVQSKHENYFPSSKKPIQPTGARKRKGGLQQQCKFILSSSHICLQQLVSIFDVLFIHSYRYNLNPINKVM